MQQAYIDQNDHKFIFERQGARIGALVDKKEKFSLVVRRHAQNYFQARVMKF